MISHEGKLLFATIRDLFWRKTGLITRAAVGDGSSQSGMARGSSGVVVGLPSTELVWEQSGNDPIFSSRLRIALQTAGIFR